jgi:gp6-like head-tail connector protein
MAASDLTTLADVKAWLNTTGTFGTTDDALLTRLITAASQFLKNWLSRDIVLTNYTELRDGVGSQSFSFANFPVTAVYAVNVAGVNIPPIPQTSGTLTTSGATAAGDPTLTFANVPSWVVQGLTITDPTTAGAVPSATTVESTTPTTVVMSQNAAGSGVASGDLIVFGPAPGGIVIPQISSFYPPAGYVNSPTKLVILGYCVPRQPLCVSLIYQAGYATVPPDIAQACIELVALRYRLERQHPGVTADHIGTAAGDGVTYSQKDMNEWMRTTLQQYRNVTPISANPRGF